MAKIGRRKSKERNMDKGNDGLLLMKEVEGFIGRHVL